MSEDTPALLVYQRLLAMYEDSDGSKQAHKEYEDTLMEYTLEVMKAATTVVLEGLDIEDTEVHVVRITERQRTALLASGMLDLYITGKDTTDD